MAVALSQKNTLKIDSALKMANPTDLKGRSVRGSMVSVLGQGLNLVLRTGSIVVLARLLSPEDFGLQGMVVTITGFLGLFRDAGLSLATVQKEGLTREHTSTLFWINVGLGLGLAVVAILAAPMLVGFYREPRLLMMTIASAAAFLFNGLTVQHVALIRRAMRFTTMAVIDTVAMALSTLLAIAMAAAGFGYWALIGMTVCMPVITAIGVWMVMPWLPGRPMLSAEIRSMLRFGGIVTLNTLVLYFAYNIEKILLGRVWGAEQLGIYGRAFQLATLPVEQLTFSIGIVAVPSLSRIQGDRLRISRSFLKGYSGLLAVALPVALSSILFAEEIVRVVLGPKWSAAAAILRFLGPTILAFVLINPFTNWLLAATGQVGRCLKISCVMAPVLIAGIVAGLSRGPAGVAAGYSVAMVLLVVPVVIWASRDTAITAGEYWHSIKPPVFSAASAAVAGAFCKTFWPRGFSPMLTLAVGLTVLLCVYGWTLLVAMGQKHLYTDLFNHLFRRRLTVAASTTC